jgi:hypothetical protein
LWIGIIHPNLYERMMIPMNDETTRAICDPNCCGLPAEAIADLGNRLQSFWERYCGCFKTKTRDVAEQAWTYLQGLLLMNTGRNFANIDRRVVDPERDGQNLQQFMSDSPWAAQPPIQQVQQEIASTRIHVFFPCHFAAQSG